MPNNRGMQNLINLVSQLQDAVAAAGMSLGDFNFPQIAVVGGQSAGKSSVLESFIGRDFLPRGEGIVTRCPLILQLEPSAEEYAIFSHSRKQFEDFNDVRNEILKQTERLAGRGQDVTDVPIKLTIYSPHVLKLNLVDLPGLARVPIGEQSEDIEDQIRETILKYISNENTLILAVTPANQDLASSDALNLAKTVDPKRERTIGVITKLDLMDKGTDVQEVLENKVYPLKRGFVGVKNRCQEDIVKQKDIQAAQDEETKFFQEHPSYKNMADKMGTKYLQRILNEQLAEHIHKVLPDLQKDIGEKFVGLKEQLDELKAFNEDSPNWKYNTVIRFLQDFNKFLEIELQGHSIDVSVEKKTAGAEINIFFYSSMNDSLNQVPKDNLDGGKLRTLIDNLHGYRSGVFSSELAFDVMIKRLLKLYKEPLLSSINVVSDIIMKAISAYCQEKFIEYPYLNEKVVAVLNEEMKEQEEKAKEHLLCHIEAQCAFMNIRHPDFSIRSYFQPVVPEKEPWESEVLETAATESEDSGLETEEGSAPSTQNEIYNSRHMDDDAAMLIHMTKNYMVIVHKTICDILPKYLVHFLINAILDFSRNSLVAEVTRGKEWVDLLKECPDIAEKKKDLFQLFNAINKAKKIISEISSSKK